MNGHKEQAEALRRWADAEEGMAYIFDEREKEREGINVKKMRDLALYLDEKQQKIKEGLDHERNRGND